MGSGRYAIPLFLSPRFLSLSYRKQAREIDEVAQEVGVPTTEYTLQQIAYDAQALLYRMVFCEGWTDEKWLEAMAYVKGQMTRKGAKRLCTDTLMGCVYEWTLSLK